MNSDLNNENILNFQNLTPEEYENLRHRHSELLLLNERMTSGLRHRHSELLLLNERLNTASKEKMDSMENQTKDRLPDEHLVAFEEGVEFCKKFVCHCLGELAVAIQNYERNKHQESYEDEAYGEDSSDEIERMKEVAKANNHRTKRSKFRPDDISVHECVRLGVVDDEEVAAAIRDGIDPTVFGFGSLVLVEGATYPVDRLVLQGWTEGDGSGADGYRLADFFDSDGRYLGRDQHGIEPVVGLAD